MNPIAWPFSTANIVIAFNGCNPEGHGFWAKHGLEGKVAGCNVCRRTLENNDWGFAVPH